MFRSKDRDPQNQQIMAAVASEAKPYNHPEARYPRAEEFRLQRAEGVARRSYGEAQAA